MEPTDVAVVGGGSKSMRGVGRMLVVLAILLPAIVLSAQVASGSAGSGVGTAVMKCGHWKDGMRVAPGLTNTPANQSVAAHGRVYGCNKAGGGGTFLAALHATAATCHDYSLSGTARFGWANGTTSIATLVFQEQPLEPAKFLVSGEITSGPFATLLVHAWLRFTLDNTGHGPLCSRDNPVTKIEFTNSQSLQLFTPVVPTTTTTFPRTNTTRPVVTTTTVIVPVTAHKSTTTAPAPATTAHAAVPAGSPTTTAPPSGGGTLPFTGSGGVGGLIGLEAIIAGAALGCFREDRRRRARRLLQQRMGPQSWLMLTMPEE